MIYHRYFDHNYPSYFKKMTLEGCNMQAFTNPILSGVGSRTSV